MQKITILIIILITICVFARCDKGLESSQDSQTFTMTEGEYSPGYQFPEGYYYMLELADRFESISPFKMLDSLFTKGIIIKIAWYRGPLGGCKPPDSNISTKTFYPTYFVVMLSEQQTEILKYDFVKIESPTSIPCGYETQIYTRINK